MFQLSVGRLPPLQFFCFRFKYYRGQSSLKLPLSDKLQFFCFRFNYAWYASLYRTPCENHFNSSVLDSEPWAYLFLFKFFLPRSRVFVRGFIPVVVPRLVKPLMVSRPRHTKNSNERFNFSISWGFLRCGCGDSFASCLLCWCFIAWECLLLRPMGLGAYLASTVTQPQPKPRSP